MNLKKKLVVASTSALLVLGLGVTVSNNTSQITAGHLPPEYSVKDVAGHLPPEYSVKDVAGHLPPEYSVKDVAGHLPPEYLVVDKA